MKLYKVSQDIRNGYDTYDSIVVLAKNEDSARIMHPDGYLVTEKKDLCGDWVDYENLNKVSITLLADVGNKLGKEPKVILASFNAG